MALMGKVLKMEGKRKILYYEGKYPVEVVKEYKGEEKGHFLLKALEKIPFGAIAIKKGTHFLAHETELSTKPLTKELREAIEILKEAYNLTRGTKVREKIRIATEHIKKVEEILKRF